MKTVGGDGQYSMLLRRMTSIQGELSQAIDLSRSYKRQNQKLVEAGRRVKDERDAAQAKVHEQRRELNVASLQRVESERQYDAATSELRTQLEQRVRECAALEKRATAAAPPDLDVVRAKIAEELAAPHTQQVRALEDELARQREMCYATNRELQLQRTQLQQYTEERQRDVELHKARHLELESELRRQLDEARTTLDDTAADTRLVEAKREVQRLHARCSVLDEEVEGAVRDRDAAIAARDEATALHARDATARGAHLAVAEEKAAKGERTAASASAQRDATARAVAEASDRALRAEEAAHEAVERAKDFERRSAEVTSRGSATLEALRRETSERETALSTQVARLQRSVDEEGIQLRDEREANEKALARLVSELEQARREKKQTLSSLRLERIDLEQRLSSATEQAVKEGKARTAAEQKLRTLERDAKRRDLELTKTRDEIASLKSGMQLTTTTTATVGGSGPGSSSSVPPIPQSQGGGGVNGRALVPAGERSEVERKIRAKAMRYIANLRQQLADAEKTAASSLVKEKRRSKRYKAKLLETRRKYQKARKMLDRTRRSQENLAREHRARIQQVRCAHRERGSRDGLNNAILVRFLLLHHHQFSLTHALIFSHSFHHHPRKRTLFAASSHEAAGRSPIVRHHHSFASSLR